MALPDTAGEHKEQADTGFSVAVLTLSTTRDRSRDRSGDLIEESLTGAGHRIWRREVLPDEAEPLREHLIRWLDEDDGPDAIVTSGGTGLAASDITIETAVPLFDKELTAFGPMFAQLSYEEVQASCILSRATAGIRNERAVFCLPGSPKACRLALDRLIIPELGHVLYHARKG